MKFLIRDDDTCAFTDPEDLKKCYNHIWNDIPVNLSVTPFRIPGAGQTVPAVYRGITRAIPLEENEELVKFLQEILSEGKICIAMHGNHHTKPYNLPEYIGETNLEQKTREGKRYLEKLLSCTIDTFVPPNNGIAKEGLSAIVKNQLNLIGIPSLVRNHYRPVRFVNFKKYLMIKYFKTIHDSYYPHILSVDGHKEVSYCSVTPSQNMAYILKCFEISRKFNGVFIFATHYHAFKKKLTSGEFIGDVLDQIIYKAKDLDNVQFCTYNQLWNKQ